MKKSQIYGLYLVIIIFILSACTSKEEKTSKYKSKDMAPSSLKEISQGLDKVFESTGKIEKMKDGTFREDEEDEEEEVGPNQQEKEQSKKDDKEDKKEEEAKEEEKEDKEEDKKEGEDDTDKNMEESDTDGEKKILAELGEKKGLKENDEKLLKEWEKLDKTVEEIHLSWNKYQIEAIKKGISDEQEDKFRNSLNALTKSTEKRNILEIYDYGSQSLGDISPMYELYTDEIAGNISSLKYLGYRAYLMAIYDKKEEALKLLDKPEEYINKIRLKKDKEDDDENLSLEKVIYSFKDMKKSLEQNSIRLYRIKRDILIENLKELEDLK